MSSRIDLGDYLGKEALHSFVLLMLITTALYIVPTIIELPSIMSETLTKISVFIGYEFNAMQAVSPESFRMLITFLPPICLIFAMYTLLNTKQSLPFTKLTISISLPLLCVIIWLLLADYDAKRTFTLLGRYYSTYLGGLIYSFIFYSGLYMSMLFTLLLLKTTFNKVLIRVNHSEKSK